MSQLGGVSIVGDWPLTKENPLELAPLGLDLGFRGPPMSQLGAIS